ncbi:MAG: N-acetylglucosamine-6-phosphate deacetylase [Anaerolineae bacterium]|nr:N-acetylglucosamine-6-phosphate deacetylase [Anaerolineae bacterium]
MKKKPRTLITNGTIITPARLWEGGAILVEGGRIASIGRRDDFGTLPDAEIMDATGHWVAPGYVDVHVHGAVGRDMMEGTAEAISTAATFFARHGTTAFLPTSITDSPEAIGRFLGAVVEAQRRGTGGAQVLGAHVEGPYINPKMSGAQPTEFIRPADRQEYERWFASGVVRLITLAPEIPENRALIPYALQHGAVVSIGHSAATYQETMAAVGLGVNHATHTFNAMSGLHHRDPGTVGAVLYADKVYAELIADTVHVHPAAMAILVRAKGSGRTVLVTDAMAAAGLGDGDYPLGAHVTYVRNSIARVANGSLAGSLLTMDQAVKNIVRETGSTLAQAVERASLTPARSIDVADCKGSLEPGKDADVLLLDKDLNVTLTMVRGEIVYRQ